MHALPGHPRRSSQVDASVAALGTPFAPAALVDAALAAVEGHGLGRDEIPDILWISFSGFDKAGHTHGPNHRRMESMLAAVDAEVARLLVGLRKAVPGGGCVHRSAGLAYSSGPEISSVSSMPISR